MKRIIIKASQLPLLKEGGVITVASQAKGNDLSSFSRAATDTNTQSDIQKARSVGDVNLVVNGPKTSDDMPQQEINVSAGDTVQNAISTQANSELVQQGGSLKITGDGFGESKVFTKKSIEEARLKNMRNEGRVLTKKQLFEDALNSAGIEQEIGKLPLFNVLEAYKYVGGDVQALSTERDVLGVICNKYAQLTPEMQDKFMRLAKGETVDNDEEPIDLNLDF